MNNQATIRRTATDKPQTLGKASAQWATRPADQRFDSLEALLESTRRHAAIAKSIPKKLNKLRAVSDGSRVLIESDTGATVTPTHWAFGQLCGFAGAPAAYLRTLPAEMAAKNLSYGLMRDDTERHLLVTAERTLRGVNGARYRRIWNHEVAGSLVSLHERCPSWQFPEPFRTVAGSSARPHGEAEGKQVPIAFASDHDMFAFMVDYENPVELDGNPMARGFFVENSEVGAASFRLTTFLFDFVCCNILVWGARNVTEISIPHIGSVRERVLAQEGEVLATLQAYADTPASEQISQIRKAQSLILGDTKEDVVATLFRKVGIAKGTLEAAYTIAEETPRYGDPKSAWGMVNGITELSQKADYTDERIKLDRAAGDVLGFAF